MFIPLQKADAAQRLVFGSFDETPDRAREVCDYPTAKEAFQAWSASMEKASGGKSKGNIRGQHDLKKAAGKLIELTFDDDAKRIEFCAKIVDDNEWKKVEEGVYTGFSPGGKYAKRWQDGDFVRYTPDVRELSIVDIPCNPTATFTMVKADGEEEDREFTLAAGYEPGNDATRDRAATLAKAAGKPNRASDFVVQARADLIAENADAELAKMDAGTEEPAEPADPVVEPSAADVLAGALQKADAVLAGSDQADAGPFSDIARVADALLLISTTSPTMNKSLWSAEWLSCLLREFSNLQSEMTWDAKHEIAGAEADMTLPAQAARIVKAIGDLLVTMTQEGVADMITGIENNGIEIMLLDGEYMELASQITDLVKADADLMEKAGKRNSKADGEKIQSMHDNAVALGATCDAAVEKAADLLGENDRLTKAVGEAVPRVEKLTKAVETLTTENTSLRTELDDLKKQAAPPKGVIFEVKKGEDGDALTKTDGGTDDDSNLSLIDRARRLKFT